MRVVYVCSRFKGDVKKHKKWATKFSNFIAEQGYIPITVHLFLDEAMGLSEDNSTEDRERLLKAGREIVLRCDEVWVYMPDGIMSHGMQGEVRVAEENKIPVKIFRQCKKDG